MKGSIDRVGCIDRVCVILTHHEWLTLSAGVQFAEDTGGKQRGSDSRTEDQEEPDVSVTHSVFDTHGVQDGDGQLAQSGSDGAGT